MTEAVEVDVNIASPGYFPVVRTPVIEGRNFSGEDAALADPVVIVNDVFARRYFSPTAVGRSVRDFDGTSYEIVGVVRSARHRALQAPPEPMVYFPLSQRHLGQLHLVVRTEYEAGPFLEPLRALLQTMDERVQIISVMTFEQHLSEALSLDRFATTIVLGCALAALLLATIGVYGVLTDAVRRRTAEIGLRVALGASRPQVLRLVFGEGLHLAVAGVVAGVAVALVLRRVAGTFVHGLPVVDLASLAAVPIGLVLVVIGAAAIPTVRALRVSPTIALRVE
jgi:ABC-type antimicrobial peptide transport system permease subunit